MRFCIVFSHASDVSEEDISEEDISEDDISEEDIAKEEFLRKMFQRKISLRKISLESFLHMFLMQNGIVSSNFQKKRKIIIISNRNTYQSHHKWQG